MQRLRILCFKLKSIMNNVLTLVFHWSSQRIFFFCDIITTTLSVIIFDEGVVNIAYATVSLICCCLMWFLNWIFVFFIKYKLCLDLIATLVVEDSINGNAYVNMIIICLVHTGRCYANEYEYESTKVLIKQRTLVNKSCDKVYWKHKLVNYSFQNVNFRIILFFPNARERLLCQLFAQLSTDYGSF